MERPIEQAFALISLAGFCGAARTVERGIHATSPENIDQVEAWVSIGECVNRIAAAGGQVH